MSGMSLWHKLYGNWACLLKAGPSPLKRSLLFVDLFEHGSSTPILYQKGSLGATLSFCFGWTLRGEFHTRVPGVIVFEWEDKCPFVESSFAFSFFPVLVFTLATRF